MKRQDVPATVFQGGTQRKFVARYILLNCLLNTHIRNRQCSISFMTWMSREGQCVSIYPQFGYLFKLLKMLTTKTPRKLYVIQPLYGECTGDRWIPSLRTSIVMFRGFPYHAVSWLPTWTTNKLTNIFHAEWRLSILRYLISCGIITRGRVFSVVFTTFCVQLACNLNCVCFYYNILFDIVIHTPQWVTVK